MRPIDHQELRRVADLRTLQALNTAIAKETPKSRNRFIQDHEDKCSEIRDALWNIGHRKCWYSEALLQECEGHVEHYRPKKRLWGAKHKGYWWKAFDSTNLRLAHPTVNRRKTDYLTGNKLGKGSYFPLRDETNRAQNPNEEVNEEPVLLDPVIPSDTLLLSFSEESGAPCPTYTKDKNEWLHRRAEESIDYYHLYEGTWNARRADLMAAVRKLCKQLDKLNNQNPRDEVAYNQMINEIYAYIAPHAEFSAACRQVVREMGLLEEIP